MNDDEDRTPLEALDALSRDVERLANTIAVHAKAFGPGVGERSRVDLIRTRLRVALDELDAYPHSTEDITDE